MDEFKLNENKWSKDMFSIKDRWVPAYFRYIKLSRLMSMTSRSESENPLVSHLHLKGKWKNKEIRSMKTTLIRNLLSFVGNTFTNRETRNKGIYK